MSRFRKEDSAPTRDQLLPSAFQKSSAVPVTADEVAKSRRKKVLIGVGLLVAAVAIILVVQKVSSKPVERRNYLADAQRNYELGKYTDALTSVNLALKDRRNELEGYRLRLAIYRSLDRRADAYDDVGRLIKLEPKVSDHYRTRAELAMEMNSIQKAIEDYTVLVDQYKDPSGYTGRALCYRRLGQTSKLLADLDKAIEFAPNIENYLQRGLAYAANGDHRKAISDFDRAIEIEPNASQVYRARAYSRHALGDERGSKSDTERATRLETPQL